MKNKKPMFIAVLLILAVILSGCATKKEGGELAFCQKLSKCETGSLEVEDNKTKDVYGLSILGKQNNSCEIGLSLQKAGTEKLKPLEKLEAVCSQKWNSKFEKIANFTEPACKKYIDSLTINLMANAANQNSTICTGKLREELVKK